MKQALIPAAAVLPICSQAQADDRHDCLENFDKLVVSNPERVALACRRLAYLGNARAQFNLRAKARTGGESVWTLLGRGLP